MSTVTSLTMMRPGGHWKTLRKPHPQQRQFIYRDILPPPPPPGWYDLRLSNTTGILQRQNLCGLLVLKRNVRRSWRMLNAVKMVVNMAIPWWCLNLPLICLSTVNVLIEALSKRSKLLIRGRKNVYHVVRIRDQLQLIASLWISVPYKLRSKYRPLPLATNISSLTPSSQV